MSVRSFGNPIASFLYRFGQTGNRASNPYVAPPDSASILVDGSPYDLLSSAYELTTTTAVNVTVDSPLTVNIFAWGAGGGEGVSPPNYTANQRIGGGGPGGAAGGQITLLSGTTYTLKVGGGGSAAGPVNLGTAGANGGGTGSTGAYSGGGGGGASSVHTPGYWVLVSGGGGGGGNATNNGYTMPEGGGAGGGTNGTNGGSIQTVDLAGRYATPSAGGAGGPGSGSPGGSPPGVGTVGSGGNGQSFGAGGGGGYYGGGGGGDDGGAGASGGNGGGGSGYVNPTYLTSSYNIAGSTADTSSNPFSHTANPGPVNASPYRGTYGNGAPASGPLGGSNSGQPGKIVIALP